MPEVLLKIADAAKRLSVGTDWFYERINRGEIPVVELGGTRKNQRIRESDLDSSIAARMYERCGTRMATRDQAFRDLGRVVAEFTAEFRTQTPEEAARCAWRSDGSSMEELTARCAAFQQRLAGEVNSDFCGLPAD